MISKKNVFRNAARYLGFRGKALDAGAIRLLEDAYGALLTTVEPRHILRPFPVMVTGEKLCFGELPPLESRDLCNLMRGRRGGIWPGCDARHCAGFARSPRDGDESRAWGRA